MKNIMKRAWEIYRTLTGDRIAKLSMALRQAWAEIKEVVMTGREKCIARLNTILAHSVTYDYCTLFVTVNDWENYGKNRTYFKIIEASKDRKSSKHYVSREYGYYDNIADVYVPGKNDLNKNYDFGGMNF